jgi:crotonobetainyl-CoA:carnitine CoA-transferase CaiB-like acyl-CoA transferase
MPPEVQNGRPLDGIRVLDFTRWLAGPYATSMLGDMGADVIKIEKIGVGDGTRVVDRLFGDGLSSYYLGLNRSKRSMAVDLATAEGRELILRLAREADVVIENFRPSVMRKLRLDYEDLAAVNSRLIYCSVSSFGPSGPLRDKAGMDLIVQALGGIMGLTGDPNGDPLRAGVPIGDYVGAFLSIIGILLALRARDTMGVGQRVDVALLDGQIALLANYLPGFFVNGKPDRPVGVGHPQIVPYQLFNTADGHLVVACLTEGFWRRLCDTMQLAELRNDARFSTNADRVAHRDELVPLLEEAIARWRTVDLAKALNDADIPCAPVHSLADIADDPQVRHNKMIVSLEQADIGEYQSVGVPVKLSQTPGYPSSPAPKLGEHTEEILTEAGLSSTEIDELIRKRVITAATFSQAH